MDNSQNWENKMNFSTKLQLYKTKQNTFLYGLNRNHRSHNLDTSKSNLTYEKKSIDRQTYI